MSVQVTCIYITDKCTHGLRTSDYCEEDFFTTTCDLYIAKGDRIGAPCLSYKPCETMIHKTYKAVEYEENDGLTIGKEFIPSDKIIFLSIDNNIFIDERRPQTMSKALTFGEAKELLEALRAKNGGRDPELTECLAEGYNYALKTEGYNICPFCGNAYKDRPAISRKDNKTEICPECGQAEAIEAFERYQNEKGAK